MNKKTYFYKAIARLNVALLICELAAKKTNSINRVYVKDKYNYILRKKNEFKKLLQNEN